MLVTMEIMTVLWRWRLKAQDDDGHIMSRILVACDIYLVGERSRILKFSMHHRDQSMESSRNEGKGGASTYPCRSRAEAFQ